MEDLESNELQQLARNSSKAAFLTGFGAVILLSAFAYSAYQLSELDERIVSKQQLVDEKSRQIEAADERLNDLQKKEESLNLQINVLRNQKDSLLGEFRSLSEKSHAQISSLPPIPIAALVTPRADAVLTGGKATDGRSLRKYSLWIDVPDDRSNEITEVRYLFNHPTFVNKIQSSSNAADGFRVGYTGWGCLYRIVITLVLTNGQRPELDFNMCQALGVE